VGPEGTPLGVNAIGEECRIIRTEAVRSGVSSAEQAWAIQCAGWEQPSARLVRAKAAQPLNALATGGSWRERLDAFAACEDPQPATVLGELPALELNCAVRRGGWPYAAMVTGIGDTAFLGDSIPASVGVMERAMGVLSGKTFSAEDPPKVEAGPRTPGLYSAGDLERYRRLLRAAQYHNFQGDHAEAERLYREALALQRQRIGGTDASLAFIFMHIALELSNQERFSEADATFEAADDAVRLSIDPADEVRLISYRALHYANQQRSQRAMQLAQEATTRRRELASSFGSIGRTADLASLVTAAGAPVSGPVPWGGGGLGQTAQGDIVQSRYLEAAMLLRQDKLAEAEAALQDALAAIGVDARVPRRWRPTCQSLLAEVAERRGDLRSAETLLTDSIEGFQAQAAGSRAEALAFLALGRVRAAMFRPEAATPAFRAGFAIIRDSRRGVRLDDAWPFFETALGEAARRPEAKASLDKEMFETAQLIRSTRAAHSLALASARLAASDREVGRLIRELQDARRQRDSAREMLTQARSSPEVLAPQVDLVEQRYRKADEQVAELERLVQAASPRYQLLLDRAVPVADVQAALRPGEALLQVLVGPSASLGLLVEPQGITAYRIALAERDAQRTVGLLRAPFDEVPGAPFDVGRAHALYQTLFGPVSEQLKGVKHLIFVPSGPLQTLPPGVLIAEPPAAAPSPTNGYGDYAWLVQRMALSSAPSVQAFTSLRQDVQPSRAGRALIGFGDFLPERDVGGVLRARGLPPSCRPALSTLAELPALPNTAGELQAVRATLPAGSVSLGLREAFTEQQVRSAKLSDYRIVYFATHALLPHELDCWNEPMLLTSGPAGGTVSDARDDGALLASEIMDLELDAELVVLSACNTAGPDGARSGDSLSGLARAFFYAGARALLVTQWRIPDAPTRALMTRMFEAMTSRPMSTAEALREAQTAMIREPALSHPLNWAAFTVVGDGGRRPGAAAAS